MYACLRDDSSLVRSNTLTVLTHLILNDMIKVKGQISDMALLIVDGVTKISNMAKLFFTELARKGNALYNVMPDIISGLSNPEAGIEEASFREVMKYIIALIEKVSRNKFDIQICESGASKLNMIELINDCITFQFYFTG